MFRNRLRLLGLLALLLHFFIPSSPVVAQQGKRWVFAFYYAWFDLTTWQKPLSDQPLQPYHSADVSVIEQHVLQARQAGIDALVQAWYGPGRANNPTAVSYTHLTLPTKRIV